MPFINHPFQGRHLHGAVARETPPARTLRPNHPGVLVRKGTFKIITPSYPGTISLVRLGDGKKLDIH
jgi:hypothetical protein